MKVVKRKLPDQVLKEFDAVLLDALDKIRLKGVGPTEAEKQGALGVIKLSSAYAAIARVVQKGSDEDLEKAKKIIRQEMPFAIRKPLLEAVKALPHPKGGRPKLLSDEDKSKACDLVANLIRTSGLDLPEAHRRVASQFGVGLRTMQRAWRERATVPKKQKTKPD